LVSALSCDIGALQERRESECVWKISRAGTKKNHMSADFFIFPSNHSKLFRTKHMYEKSKRPQLTYVRLSLLRFMLTMWQELKKLQFYF
jgi:hypothetical protein